MLANEAQGPHKTGTGLKEAGLAASAVAGAMLATVLMGSLFIFAAEAGGHKQLPLYDEVNLCRPPHALRHFSRLGS
jgi:hypothetical protein